MIVRIANVQDAKAIAEIYAPYVRDTAITFEYVPPSESEIAGRIVNTLREYPYVCAVENDEVIGYAYAGVFHGREAYRHCVETSIYVKQGCHRKGVGLALYQKLEELLLRQNIYILYACISVAGKEADSHISDNSMNYHAHLGYKLTGRHENCGYKFGNWYTIVWMEKLLCERPVSPEPFIPFAQLNEPNNQ